MNNDPNELQPSPNGQQQPPWSQQPATQYGQPQQFSPYDQQQPQWGQQLPPPYGVAPSPDFWQSPQPSYPQQGIPPQQQWQQPPRKRNKLLLALLIGLACISGCGSGFSLLVGVLGGMDPCYCDQSLWWNRWSTYLVLFPVFFLVALICGIFIALVVKGRRIRGARSRWIFSGVLSIIAFFRLYRIPHPSAFFGGLAVQIADVAWLTIISQRNNNGQYLYHSNPFLFELSVLLPLFALVLFVILFIIGVTTMARLKRWGWFFGLLLGSIGGAAILILPGLALIVYGLAAPRTPRVAPGPA